MVIDIQQRRKELGLTLEQVGKLVGVSKSTVKKWESGYIQNMRRDKIMLLADALRISPLDILDCCDSDAPTEASKPTKKAVTSEYTDFIKAFFQCDDTENLLIFHSKAHAIGYTLTKDTFQKIAALLKNSEI